MRTHIHGIAPNITIFILGNLNKRKISFYVPISNALYRFIEESLIFKFNPIYNLLIHKLG